MTKIKILPSIISADFAHLAKEVARIEASGADAIHVDIMDGHFVPNLTIGFQIIETLRRLTKMQLDVHFMGYRVYDYVERFISAGADTFNFHYEATEDIEEVINYVKTCGKKVGLVFNPETSISVIDRFLPMIDTLLLMSVHPGFGGQEFIAETIEKIRFSRELIDRFHIREGGVESNDPRATPPFEIKVDGGITEETMQACVKAGANAFVVGTYLFKQPDMKKTIAELHSMEKLSKVT